MTTTIPTVTLTLPADEAAYVLGSISKSQRPSIRKIAERLRSETTLPLMCPVSFKDGDAELCGVFGEGLDIDGTLFALTAHLTTVHEVAPEPADFQARVAIKRWAPPAE